MTTRAFFQKASSVGLISGSSTTAAWTSSSVMPRRRFQSVTALAFEILPIVSSLMRLRSPCGNDVSLVLVTVGVDDGDLDAVHQPDSVDPDLAVLEPVIHSLDRRSLEDPGCIGQPDCMPADVRNVLGGIPGEPHWLYLRYVFTQI